MNSIKEESIEKDALETLAKQGYQVIKSEVYNHTSKIIDAERNNDHTKFILEPRLAKVLKELNPGYSDDIYRRALHEFSKLADNPDMMINNHYMHKLLIEGVKIKTSENGENKTVTLHAIDFDNWENNDFLATNQFEIVQGEKSRRTDITVFVNGLPLITFELKKPDNENITVKEAYEQLQTYKAEIPDYMKYNEILIASDGVNARVGSLTAGFDRFMRWRQPKNELVPEGSLELDILIEYMLKPKTLLNIIQNFIIFETNGDSTVKILTAYHQYYMVNKAVVAAERALKSNSDKRIGVVWHTTGSGKSLSMVFFSGIVARKLGNPTILVINDRNDLDDQLFGTFAQAHEYLQQTPDHAENRDEVRDYMSRNSGGIVFSTIQKFSPDFERGENEMPVLTNRSDVIVMADEAHRTQYGLQAELTKNGVRYGYAKYLRDALPNASFIGFTGTPIDTADKSTVAVFGNYIDVYDITQSVADHATVRIFYESHIIPLKLKSGSEEKFNELMNEYDLNTEASDSEKEARNKELTKLEA
ncbi:HsdR family type I site-specific deoxyribonuclease, partial [Lactobacillus mulieris]